MKGTDKHNINKKILRLFAKDKAPMHLLYKSIYFKKENLLWNSILKLQQQVITN